MAQGTTKGVPIDIDPLLAADSDLLVPSQKAIKTYITNTSVALTGVQTIAGAKTFSSLSSFSAGITVTPPTGSGTTSAGIIVSGSNTNGGTSYNDFLKVTNTASGATNINKWFRVNGTGGLEIINSAYTTNLFTLTDAGVLTTASNVNGASPTEMGYLSGVTSAIQTQINTKITGGSVYLTSDFSTSNTTAQNTGLKFSIAANEKYNVTVVGTCSKATTNTGLRVAVGAPTGCTVKGVEYRGQAITSTALQNGLITAINTLGGTFATGIGVEVPFRMEFVVSNGANAGVIELQLATVTSNTATVYAYTRMDYFKSTAI